LKILSISVRDFLSIGEVSLSFPNSGLILIEGWNHDKASANGAGKSSILSAITWCLYGKIPRNITASSIIRTSCKKTSVSIECEIQNKTYTISRSRPGDLTISRQSAVSESITQLELEKLIGLSYERYIAVAYFAQGIGSRFLDLSDTDKKQLFLDLSKAGDYSAAKDKIDSTIKTLFVEKTTIEKSVSQTSSRLEELRTSYVGLESIHAEIETNTLEIAKLQKALSLIDISTPDISKHKELISKLKLELQKIAESKGELRQLHSALKRLSSPIEVTKTDACPHCSGSLIVVDGAVEICDIESIKKAESSSILKRQEQIQAVKLQITDLDKLISKESRILDAIDKCTNQMDILTEDSRRAQSKADSIESKLHILKNSKTQLSKELQQIEKVNNRILELEASLKVNLIELESKTKALSIVEAASHILGPSGIQAYVLDSIIDQFNASVVSILSEGWPGLSYELLSFKENKTGAISTRFSDNIAIDGVSRSLGALSGGERKCLAVAIDLAIAKTFELHSGFLPKPLILDEPFDSMDSNNREHAISILQQFASTTPILVVDHQNETKGLFDKVIYVDKRNGVTSATIE
jgi:DNA repair exonuclease SbcCD ATPase subunit